jgi:hypothetical protein
MSRRKRGDEQTEPRKSREDDTGVFHRMIDDAAHEQRIANRLLRAVLNRDGDRRVVIVTREYERAEGLRKMLVSKELTDAVSIATNEFAAQELLRTRRVALVIAEPEFAEVCRNILGSREHVLYVLNGHDEATVAEIEARPKEG